MSLNRKLVIGSLFGLAIAAWGGVTANDQAHFTEGEIWMAIGAVIGMTCFIWFLFRTLGRSWDFFLHESMKPVPSIEELCVQFQAHNGRPPNATELQFLIAHQNDLRANKRTAVAGLATMGFLAYEVWHHHGPTATETMQQTVKDNAQQQGWWPS